MVPPLDNYISKEPASFFSNQANVSMVLEMIHTVIHDSRAGEVEKTDACKLLIIVILNGSPFIDQLIPGFIEVALKAHPSAEGTALKVLTLECVIACLYYNPLLAFNILESKGWTLSFFSVWMTLAEKFPR